MENKKYQVFVSSTYVDLIDARKKVIDTVLSLYHFPVGMEMFSADDSEQWEIIRETIQASDYYVIVIGHKYGSISSGGISYTEMEYNYAKSLNIPILAFIRNRDVLTKPHEREVEQSKSEQLERFIEKAKANKVCDFWESIDELATKVAVALPKIMRRTPQTGWVRGNQITSKEVTSELVELSNENRKLREKIRLYESQFQTDGPILELSMIDEDIHIDIKSTYIALEYFKHVNEEDIPSELKGLVSLLDIDVYNELTPTDSEVDSFNKRARIAKLYKENSISFIPILGNSGKKPASDIYVEIKIPEFMSFVYSDNKRKFEAPVINIPKSPIEKAASIKKTQSLSDMHFGDININGSLGGESSSMQLSEISRKLSKITPSDRTNWVIKEPQKITLRARKIIQSLEVEFESITISPLAIGSGLIIFKMICEELKEPIIFTRKIVVDSI